jgi:hypothetical protein
MDEPERDRARARRAQELDDFNNETAGRETGRMRRFVSSEESGSNERQRREGRELQTWLLHLTIDERLTLLRARLAELDQASLIAMQAAERRALDTERQIDRLRDAATRDAHGRQVYRSADGLTAYYEDGRRLTDDEFSLVEWRAGAPTWEERQRAAEARQRAVRDLDDIGAYRDWLDTARRRLESSDPLTGDELSELEAGTVNIPEVIAAETADHTRHTATGSGDSGNAPPALSADELSELATIETDSTPPRVPPRAQR